MVPFVVEDMDQLYDAPALQLLQARADIRSRHPKSVRDFLGVQRFGRNIKQGMDLGDGAIDAPSRPHFAPMEHELLFDWRQFVHQFLSQQKYMNFQALSSVPFWHTSSFRGVANVCHFGTTLSALRVDPRRDVARVGEV